MKRILQATCAISAVLGLAACNSTPIAQAPANRTATPTVVATNTHAEPTTVSLGAGDRLGQQVFTRAVELARAQDTSGWRYADAEGAAIFPAFRGGNGESSYNDANPNMDLLIKTLVNAEARTAPLSNVDAAELTPSPTFSNAGMVLVPDPYEAEQK